MENIKQVLQEIGLTKNETEIYLFLLKSGETTTGSIIKETGIANSRVYNSISSLIDKGLIIYNTQKDGKHFSAVSPEIILKQQEDRKKKIESIIPNLKSMSGNQQKETLTAIYEGFQGFKTAFQKIIEDCPKEETIHILGFSSQPYATESLRTFLANMNLKSQNKKQKLKILLDPSSKDSLGKDRKNEKYSEVRYMPKGYISPAAIDIFQDYVYMFLWEEKPFVFMIKNKRIAESFKQYFNLLWNIAKR